VDHAEIGQEHYVDRLDFSSFLLLGLKLFLGTCLFEDLFHREKLGLYNAAAKRIHKLAEPFCLVY